MVRMAGSDELLFDAELDAVDIRSAGALRTTSLVSPLGGSTNSAARVAGAFALGVDLATAFDLATLFA